MKYKNNPLNIRNSNSYKWQGQSGSKKGFCEFTELEYGIRAACYLIMVSYRKAGVNTLASIIRRWAPASDNNPTDSYIEFVGERTNLLRWAPINTPEKVAKMVIAMAEFEQGRKPEFDCTQVVDIIDKYHLRFFTKNKVL